MDVEIRRIAAADLPQVATLIEAAFAAGIAPGYGDDGRAAFRGFATEERIRKRLSEVSRGWVAVDAGAVVGYIEMTGDHLRMLFVRPDRQRAGIGRCLFQHVLQHRAGRDVTVHSAPNSDGFYRRLGFAPTGPQEARHGIVFTPMRRPSDPAPPAPRLRGSVCRR